MDNNAPQSAPAGSNSLKESLQKVVVASKGSAYARIWCILTLFDNDDAGAAQQTLTQRH